MLSSDQAIQLTVVQLYGGPITYTQLACIHVLQLLLINSLLNIRWWTVEVLIWAYITKDAWLLAWHIAKVGIQAHLKVWSSHNGSSLVALLIWELYIASGTIYFNLYMYEKVGWLRPRNSWSTCKCNLPSQSYFYTSWHQANISQK